jgi:hypothetical protein
LCINKLFVLPGTPLTEQMRRDGKAMEDGSRDDLFGYYCRLFSIASLSPFSSWVVRLVKRFDVFRRRPALINMPALEFGFRVVNALHRRALRLRSHARPRTADSSSPVNSLASLETADVQAKAANQDLFQIQ